MKNYKYLIFAAIVVMGIIAGYVYFVTGVSAVYPPIKEYRYRNNVDQLLESIQKFVINSENTTYDITDTVGNEENGYAMYVTIFLKRDGRDIEYYLKCENSDVQRNRQSVIKLVGAYDKLNNTGGYSNTAEGVKPLVDIFESYLVPALKFTNVETPP